MTKLNCNYTKVPYKLLELNLSFSVWKVIFYLLSWQNADSTHPSHKTIADKCNLDVSSVKKALRFLKKEKFITVVSGKQDRRTNIYIVNFDQIDEECILTPEQRELRNINYNIKKLKNKEKKILKKDSQYQPLINKEDNSNSDNLQ